MGSAGFSRSAVLTSAEPQPLTSFHYFPLPDGDNDPYLSTSHRCWTAWLVNVQKLPWRWDVAISIIMLSERKSLPVKGSRSVATDFQFECFAAHRWNIYLPIRKKPSGTLAPWVPFIYVPFKKDESRWPWWDGNGTAWLRLMSPLDVSLLSRTIAFCQPNDISYAIDTNLGSAWNTGGCVCDYFSA